MTFSLVAALLLALIRRALARGRAAPAHVGGLAAAGGNPSRGCSAGAALLAVLLGASKPDEYVDSFLDLVEYAKVEIRIPGQRQHFVLRVCGRRAIRSLALQSQTASIEVVVREILAQFLTTGCHGPRHRRTWNRIG